MIVTLTYFRYFTMFFVFQSAEKTSVSSGLKPVSTIFYQIFIFSPNDSPSKTKKNVFSFHSKSSFCFQDI